MSSSNYDVKVKLSTVGDREAAQNLDRIAMSAAKLQTQQERLNAASTVSETKAVQLGTAYIKQAQAVTQLQASMARLATTHDAASTSMSALGLTMVGAMAAFALAYRAFSEVTKGIKEFADSGIELNALLETSRLGIAATILSYRNYRDEQGNVIKGQQALDMAFMEGGNIQRLLQREAFNTTATLQQMLQAYQQLQIGASTQKTTSTELAAFVATLGNFATASGRSFEELSAQTSRVLQGVLTIRNPILAVLRGMGVSNETVKSWIQQGVAVEKIQGLLVEFLKIGPAINQSWTGILSNVKDVIQQMSGAAMGPIMESLKSLGNEFIGAFTTTFEQGGRKVTQISDEAKIQARLIGETLRLAFESALEVIRRMWAVWNSGSSDMKATLLDIALKFAEWKVIIGDIAEGLLRVGKHSLIPLQVGLGANALSIGDIATAKEKFEWIQKLIDEDVAYTMGTVGRASTRAKAIADERKRIMDAMQPREGDYSFIGPVKTPGMGQPNPMPIDTKKLDAEVAEFVRKTNEMWDQANAYTEQGLARKLALLDAEQEKENDLAEKAVNRMIEHGYDYEMAQELYDTYFYASLVRRDAKKRDAIEADKRIDAEYNAWRLGIEDRLADELLAVTRNYYDKEAAEIEKKRDRDLREINAREARDLKAAEHKEDYDRERAAAQKLSDARIAMMEEEKRSIIGYRRKWEEEAQKIIRTTDSISGGMAAGLAKIRAGMVSTTEAVSELVVAIWNDLGKAFEDGFYNILSGKFDSLKDVFKSLWDSILKDFSRMLAQMLQRWLITGETMGSGEGLFGGLFKGQTNYGAKYDSSSNITSLPVGVSYSQVSGGTATQSGAYGGGSTGILGRYGGIIGGGVAAGAAVSGIANASGAPGWNTGAMIGGGIAIADSVITSIITGAAVGATYMVIGAVVGAIVGGIVGVLTAPNTEGHVYSYGMSAQEGRNVRSQVSGGALDLYKASGLDDRAGFATSVRKYINEYLMKSFWEVHAGTTEDMTADWKRLFSQIVPTEMLHTLFGQTAVGGQDYAGISGGVRFGEAISDPNAPLARMLIGLGFSVDKVREIAGKIDSYADDPQKFLDWLNTLVGVVTGLHRNVERLGWTSAQIQADITKTAGMTDQERLAKSAADLTQLAKELSLYTGDEQIKKAQELNAAVDQYWADQEAAIKKLMDMADQLHTSIAKALESMRDALAITTGTGTQESQWLYKLYGNRAAGPGVDTSTGLMGTILGTADVTKLPALVQEAITLITNLFNLLNARLKEIYTLQAQNQTLTGQFNQNALDTLYTSGQPGALGTGTTTSDLGFMLMKAQQTSGQEQLDWIARLQNAAAARYQDELQQIKAVEQGVKDLHKSVEQQKWGFAYDAAGTPQAQAGMLMDRIKSLMGQIKDATSTEQLGQITGEIQSLTSQYWGMSDKSQGALGFVSSILDKMTAAADKQYAALFEKITADNAAITDMLKSTGGLLAAAEVDTTATLKKLDSDLTTLDELLGVRFQSSIQSIVDANAPLKKALEDDIPLFTSAGTSVGDLGRAADGATGSLNGLKTVIDDIVTNYTPGGGAGNAPSPVWAIRNNPNLIASRTGR
jgi:hypothetical protein